MRTPLPVLATAAGAFLFPKHHFSQGLPVSHHLLLMLFLFKAPRRIPFPTLGNGESILLSVPLDIQSIFANGCSPCLLQNIANAFSLFNKMLFARSCSPRLPETVPRYRSAGSIFWFKTHLCPQESNLHPHFRSSVIARKTCTGYFPIVASLVTRIAYQFAVCVFLSKHRFLRAPQRLSVSCYILLLVLFFHKAYPTSPDGAFRFAVRAFLDYRLH